MAKPKLFIDLKKIHANVSYISRLARQREVRLFGVTKSLAGSPELAQVFLDGQCFGLADSRPKNLVRLQGAGFTCPIMMIRIPAISEVHTVVANSNLCLVSEIDTVRALDQAAQAQKRCYQILIMVEMGDRREGVLAHELPNFVKEIQKFTQIQLVGLAANYGCISGVQPDLKKLIDFESLAQSIEKQFKIQLPHLSGGNSSVLYLLRDQKWPQRINFLRVGHDILLGIDGSDYSVIPDLEQGAFVISCELVELKKKPSLPEGRRALDAWGHKPEILDRGIHYRGLVNIGRLDIVPEHLTCKDSRLQVIGASSDLLVLDMGDARDYHIGSSVEFFLKYSALVQAMHSSYIEHVFQGTDKINS